MCKTTEDNNWKIAAQEAVTQLHNHNLPRRIVRNEATAVFCFIQTQHHAKKADATYAVPAFAALDNLSNK